MNRALWSWPWYAPTFAAYPLLYIAASNPGQVEGPTVVLVTAAAVATTIALAALFRSMLGSWAAAGLGAGWIVVLFYSYGPINEWWLDFVTAGLEQQAAGTTWYNRAPQLVHSLAWALIALWGLDRLRRAGRTEAPRLTAGLNLAAGVLVAVVAVQTVISLAWIDEAAAVRAPVRPRAAPGHLADPDIYYVVLDGYARADILSKYYGFDNAPFLDGLRRRGFQLSNESRANFAWTFLSLGSSLNLNYVQPLLAGQLDPESRDREDIYRLLRDNRAAQFLKQRGYRTVHLQSTWGGTGTNPYVDEFLPCDAGLFGNEYLRAVADVSWLRALNSKLSMDVANCHLRNFETLAAQASLPGPKFVFAHFIPPHHPYLFDRYGNVLRRANISDQFEFQKRLWEVRDAYVDQLVYVNRRIEEVVARLIEDSPQPPVILLVSDHGPNLKDGMRLPEQRHVRFANLTAMHLPGAPAGLLPPDVTPVNHLRRVFNFYFDAGFELLPDRYFDSSYIRPYEFQEVTFSDELLPSLSGF